MGLQRVGHDWATELKSLRIYTHQSVSSFLVSLVSSPLFLAPLSFPIFTSIIPSFITIIFSAQTTRYSRFDFISYQQLLIEVGGEEVCDCWDLDLSCWDLDLRRIKPRAPANCQILMRPPWSIHWNSSSWVSAATRTGNISRSTDPLNPAWTSELQNSEKEQNHYYFKPLNLGWFIM